MRAEIRGIGDSLEAAMKALDRNRVATRVVGEQVDRNLGEIQNGFRLVGRKFNNLMEAMDDGFERMRIFAKETRMKEVASELITFIQLISTHQQRINVYPPAQRLVAFEGGNFLDDVVEKTTNSLHSILGQIRDFAIPKNADDHVALTALELLCYGTEAYVEVFRFVMQSYRFLVGYNYHKNYLKKHEEYRKKLDVELGKIQIPVGGPERSN